MSEEVIICTTRSELSEAEKLALEKLAQLLSDKIAKNNLQESLPTKKSQ
jgi:hypothetical protein